MEGAETHIRELQSQPEILSSEIHHLINENNTISAVLSEREKTLEEVKQERQLLMTDIESTKREIESILKERQLNQQEEIRRLNELVTTISSQKEHLESKLTSQKEVFEEALKEKDQLQQRKEVEFQELRH